MAKYEKAELESTFKHHTSIGPNGEILFDAPIEIKNQADRYFVFGKTIDTNDVN